MTRAEKNLAGLTSEFDDLNVHKNYLTGIKKDELQSGLEALAGCFKSIYSGMIKKPQGYGMKDESDVKGLVKNMNFIFLAGRTGTLNKGALDINGNAFAAALKEAKVTKPERYFQILEPLGFTITGLENKIETSEKINVNYPDNKHLLAALKIMADAVAAFLKANSNIGNYYFEMLDHRVLENVPAIEPKPSVEFILSKLKKAGRETVTVFYEFINPMAKCGIKGSIGWYWTVTFTLKSTKKVIMSFKLNLDSHEVKLNLANIGKYIGYVEKLPAKMIEEIKTNGWNCGN